MVTGRPRLGFAGRRCLGIDNAIVLPIAEESPCWILDIPLYAPAMVGMWVRLGHCHVEMDGKEVSKRETLT